MHSGVKVAFLKNVFLKRSEKLGFQKRTCQSCSGARHQLAIHQTATKKMLHITVCIHTKFRLRDHNQK